MMGEVFEEGIRLKYVGGPTTNDGEGTYYHTYQSRPNCAKSITVEMVAGEMAMVPWARVVKQDDSVAMVNLLRMEEIGLEATDD